METDNSPVTVQDAVIDSTWCGHDRPLQSRTEIADMVQVLNNCRRVKGSAVTGAEMRQRERERERLCAAEAAKPDSKQVEIRPTSDLRDLKKR